MTESAAFHAQPELAPPSSLHVGPVQVCGGEQETDRPADQQKDRQRDAYDDLPSPD